MLRVYMSQNVAQAKSYYAAELSPGDYYSEGQERTGRWGGKGAALLGLSGEIKSKDFSALVDNVNPHTEEQLTPHQKGNRTPGYDFTFNAPKSLSLLYEYSRDERFLNVFREAVNETMQEIEMGMQTRVRKNGLNEDRDTGNLVYGAFEHFTARPSDEVRVPDPHLHTHCFVMNATFDDEENQWKAGKFTRLKQDAPYYEAAFHVSITKSALYHRRRYPASIATQQQITTEAHGMTPNKQRTKTEWRELIDHFLKSGHTIEQFAKQHSISKSTMYKWLSRFRSTTQSEPQDFASLPMPKQVPLIEQNVEFTFQAPSGATLQWRGTPQLDYLMNLIERLS